MAYRKVDNISIEDAHIIYRNFAGKETQYNRAGKRNFNVLFDDPDIIAQLIEDGWNLKPMQPHEDDETPKYRLEVALAFENVPPKIILIVGRKKTVLDEDSVSALDYAHILNVDLVIRPYNWVIQEGTRNEKSGIKAYVKTMYVTIEKDEFADKYDDLELEE